MVNATKGLITISPEIQSGTAVFAGTRVPVKNLFDYLRGGDGVDDFLLDFPSVSKQQLQQLLTHLERMSTYSVSDHVSE